MNMLSNLEKARKGLELKKVETAKAEMEFKILEREADIERLRENIKNQEARIEELTLEIQGKE